jgi:ADP-heptose:LPS heptosyltransferase
MSAPVVLTLRALGLGDFLTALPALRALAAAFPDHHRVLAAPAALAPLVRLSATVAEVVPAEPLAPLAGAPHQPAIGVNLHGRGPESHRVLLATRPRRLVAFAHPDVPETVGFPAWREDEHEVGRWCRLLRAHGIAADATALELVPAGGDLPVEAPPAAFGATLIHPGAAFAARQWPLDRWAAVARAERARGRRVIITGGPRDVDIAEQLMRLARLDRASVYAGRTTLLELAALVAAAGRVVSTDTGVAHLATALRTPSIVLFGPSSPSRWGPPPDRPWHRVLWSGSIGDPRAATPDSGLLAIDADAVIDALADLPAARAAEVVA